ncbi:MAG: hypothetical protein AAF902_01960 [Chloroflexota bacterium]
MAQIYWISQSDLDILPVALARGVCQSEQCFELSHKINVRPSVACALGSLAASNGTGLGNYSKAHQLQAECVQIYHELGDKNNYAVSLAILGFFSSSDTGDFRLGESQLRQAASLLRETNLKQWLGWSCQMLGVILGAQGKDKEACFWIEESLDIYRHLGVTDELLFGIPFYLFFSRNELGKQNLQEELLSAQKTIYADKLYFPQQVIMRVIATILAEQTLDRGDFYLEKAQLAIQLSYLALKIPNSSSWSLNIIFDASLNKLEQSLPSEFVLEYKKRGESMEFWPTAAHLLETLPELGW